MPDDFTHLDASGRARMVDVGHKAASQREAEAEALLRMQPATLARLLDQQLPKGDVLATARIAGILAAKRTHELIPLCHALALTSITVTLDALGEDRLQIRACCHCQGNTGVEMEALTAASVAALTVYDMCKAVDRAMVIEQVRLLRKTGGASGEYVAC